MRIMKTYSIFILVLFVSIGCKKDTGNQDKKLRSEKETSYTVGKYNNLDKNGSLDMRLEPVFDSEIINSIPENEKFYIVERTDDVWSKIKTIDEKVGYVKSELIETGTEKIRKKSQPREELKTQKVDNNNKILGNWVICTDNFSYTSFSFNNDNKGILVSGFYPDKKGYDCFYPLPFSNDQLLGCQILLPFRWKIQADKILISFDQGLPQKNIGINCNQNLWTKNTNHWFSKAGTKEEYEIKFEGNSLFLGLAKFLPSKPLYINKKQKKQPKVMEDDPLG